jgi:SsrA-binding protein
MTNSFILSFFILEEDVKVTSLNPFLDLSGYAILIYTWEFLDDERVFISMKVIAENRKARHIYTIIETAEAGIELQGTEVKALRHNAVSLDQSFARVEGGEMWIYDLYISPYDYGNLFNHNPRRPRRLLLHKKEILRWGSQVEAKGMTIVPLRMYFNDRGRVKVEIALVKPKKVYDRRQEIQEREEERNLRRVLKTKV